MFPTKDLSTIRAEYLRDVLNLDPAADVGPDSDHYLRATATASVGEGLYQKIAYVARQILPDTQDLDWLLRTCSLYNIKQKEANQAAGSVSLGGVAGTPVAAGLVLKTAGGVEVRTTASATLDGAGTATVAAIAVVAGEAGNLAGGTLLSIASAPAGLNTSATVVSLTGGTEIESAAALLDRLLFRLRYPPAGGNQYDYRRWAMEVPGVTDAHVYPLRRGIGFVDVVIVTAGGLPDPSLVAQVQTYIDQQRLLKGECGVYRYTPVYVDVTSVLTLQGVSLATAAASINERLDAYYATLKGGSTAYLNRIRAIISDTAGVVDFTLPAPTANVTTLVNATNLQAPMKGAVTLTSA